VGRLFCSTPVLMPSTSCRFPAGMTLKQAMGIGTAGFTAMQSVIAAGAARPETERRPVLVTGASGGVGSVAVAILANLGYQVAASTGRPEQHEYLRGLGASEIIDRAALAAPIEASLGRRTMGWRDRFGRWRHARLGAAIHRDPRERGGVRTSRRGGAQHSVFPFILRGVNILASTRRT